MMAKNYIKRFIAGFILAVFLITVSAIPFAPVASAQFGIGGIIGSIGGLVQCAVDFLSGGFLGAGAQNAYASVPVHETAQAKEGCPDIAAWFTAKVLLRQLVGDIIDWIKTGGYDERPLYVEDFRAYLIEAEDRGKAIFLNELNNEVADLIGEPFRDFILLRFNSRVNKDIFPHAIYDATIEDPQAFYNDFAQGGFEAYMQTILNPANNPWGAILLEEDRLAAQEATEYTQTYLETVSSEGFLPDKGKCLATEDFGAGPICIKFGKIKIPGSNIQDILNEAFETDLTTLENADEIKEIILAFLSRLILGGILDFDSSEEGLNPVPDEEELPQNTTLNVATSCTTGVFGSGPQNTITWTPTGGTVYIRFCTGTGCGITTANALACQSTTGSCTHGNLLPNTVYGYQAYTSTLPAPLPLTQPISDIAYVTTGTCEEPPPPPSPSPSPQPNS